MENQRQYEFCHHWLERVLVGGVKQSPPAAKAGRKTSRWRLFQGKSSNKDTAANTSRSGKQNKAKKKKVMDLAAQTAK